MTFKEFMKEVGYNLLTTLIDELINLEIGDTNVFYPHIKKNRPWDIEEMDWYDLREHANTMSDFIQKLYNYI